MKTRLTPFLTRDQAAGLASAMFCDVWQAVSSTPGVRPVLATIAKGQFPVEVPPEDLWLQGDGDLGARIETILRRALATTPVALAVGADSPLLTPTLLNQAIEVLASSDAVMGRTSDGGFYLLGLRQCPTELLRELPWSTPATAAATLARLLNSGFSVGEISCLDDVDVAADVPRLVRSLEETSHAAPATRAWLVQAGLYRPL